MTPTPDVLVIGGGIIGLTSAYFLANEGLRVEVIDRGHLGREASWAGAGIIPPGNPALAAAPYDRLRALSVSRFPEVSAELRESTGIDNGYFRCGGIEFLTAEDRYALELWDAEGIRSERLDPVRSGLEHAVRYPRETDAYLLPDCGQVRNPWHLRALIAACERLGVGVVTGNAVRGWVTSNGRITAVRTESGESRAAGRFLIASGAWADGLLAAFGCRPGVVPVRGQIVLYRPERPLFTRVLMAGKRYLVPRRDGRVLVGSTEEPEAGFEKANTTSAVEGLKRFAEQLVPALADTPVEKTWAGLRPGSPDGMPFIGPVPGQDNVFAAVGHYRAGVQLSLGTGELVRDLLTGRDPRLPAGPFRLDRPPDVTARSAFRS